MTGNLPEFLPTLRVGAPAIGIFFDILIGKDHFECSTPMIEIQHILDQEPIRIHCGDEELIDPFTDVLAHSDFLVRRRSRMASHNHSSVRQTRTQFQPPSLKQINDHTGGAGGDACRRWMSQDALDLGMLQELIASSPCHQIHACKHELCNHDCITILSVEAHQSHVWTESKVLQVGGDGLQCRSQLGTIVAIAPTCIGTDPLARMHLESGRAGAYHFPSFAPCVAWRTNCVESALCSRQFRRTRQRALPRCLACAIDIKDDVAATLSIPDATDGFWGPPFGKAGLLEEPAKGL